MWITHCRSWFKKTAASILARAGAFVALVRGWLRPSLGLYFGIALLLVWKVVDPLGVDKALVAHVTSTAARMVGAWYPQRFCMHDCESFDLGRDRILVVL